MRYLLLLIPVFFLSCMKQATFSSDPDLKNLIRSGQQIFVENQVITQDLDFTSLLTPQLVGKGVYQVTVVPSVTFKNCTFKGKVLGFRQDAENNIFVSSFQQNLSFLDCIFEEEVNFRASSIQGRADFSGSAFYQPSSFEEASFLGNAYFTKTIFYGDARFQNTIFQKKFFCIDAEFQKVCSFQHAAFQADAHFNLSRFYGYANMGLGIFHQHAYFNYANFNSTANFNLTSFRGRFELISASIVEGSFRESIFWEKSSFLGVVIEKKIDMKNAHFISMSPEIETQKKILNYMSKSVEYWPDKPVK